QIERQVDPEALRIRQRIDEVAERGPSLQREVVAAREIGLRQAFLRQSLHPARQARGLKPRAVDERARAQARFTAIHAENDALRPEHHAGHLTAGAEYGAVPPRLREQREHQSLRVNDSGERRMERRLAGELGLEAPRLAP